MFAAPTVVFTPSGTTLASTGTVSATNVNTEGFFINVASSSGAGMRGNTNGAYTAAARL